MINQPKGIKMSDFQEYKKKNVCNRILIPAWKWLLDFNP